MEIELIKKCCNCCNMLKLNEFNKNKCSKDGLQGMCKKCDKEYRNKNKKKAKKYQKIYREENKEKAKCYQKEYRKTSQDYQKNYQKKYRKQNPDYQKNYRKINKEKFTKYLYHSSDIYKNRLYVSIVLKPKILCRDNKCCVLCKSLKNLVIHHIIPVKIDKNKVKDVKNLVTLCRSCHLNKAHIGCFKYHDKDIKIKLQQYIINIKQ